MRAGGRGGRGGLRGSAGGAHGRRGPTAAGRPCGRAQSSRHGRGRTTHRRRTPRRRRGRSAGGGVGPRRRSSPGEIRLDNERRPWHKGTGRPGLSELGAVTRVRSRPPGPHLSTWSAWAATWADSARMRGCSERRPLRFGRPLSCRRFQARVRAASRSPCAPSRARHRVAGPVAKHRMRQCAGSRLFPPGRRSSIQRAARRNGSRDTMFGSTIVARLPREGREKVAGRPAAGVPAAAWLTCAGRSSRSARRSRARRRSAAAGPSKPAFSAARRAVCGRRFPARSGVPVFVPPSGARKWRIRTAWTRQKAGCAACWRLSRASARAGSSATRSLSPRRGRDRSARSGSGPPLPRLGRPSASRPG